ncbi:MAG TPA: hypothetical protein VK034_17630 [Enhygromyxa sp.]|nr:hypothetical protein [Enhygromyxa sp.]
MTDDVPAKLRAMLFDALREYAEDAGLDIELGDETPLFGGDSALDSIGLVTVLAEFEAAINDAYGTDLVLADDRAMAMKRSPFRTPARLLEFAAERLAESRVE